RGAQARQGQLAERAAAALCAARGQEAPDPPHVRAGRPQGRGAEARAHRPHPARPSARRPVALPRAMGEVLTPICLAGPTGCGKTAAALAIAEVLPVEIISVDSALVYRGMDIGTAKPTPAEMALAPHHLIDIIEPTASYSAAEFVRAARKLAEEIAARGRLPLLVGGTMLYFKA